jgi:arsenite methyltransferase
VTPNHPASPRPDLLYSEETREQVRAAYAGVASTRGRVAERLYSPEELAQVPAQAVERSLGVGNHLRHARIAEGDTVLDLGCGAGIDSILAARRTGPSGTVHALDFLPEMLERTAAAAAEAGLANVRTVEAEMESIPLPDACVDHVISNGAINLSPRKARVFAECARVLRPGGEICASDVTVEEEDLPTEVRTHPAAWAG